MHSGPPRKKKVFNSPAVSYSPAFFGRILCKTGAVNVKMFIIHPLREDSHTAFWTREGMREIQISFMNSHQVYGTSLVKD